MSKQEMKFWACMFENVPAMSSGVMQGWIDNPKGLKKFLSGLAAEEEREYTRHLRTVTLAPTRGETTLAEATDVFTGYLDGDFRNWGTNVPGKDTPETAVDVHEMTRNGTFKQLFESHGDPCKLVLHQGQIVEFCRNHRYSLRQEGCGTFFLFEVNGELFVARVCVYVGKLRASVECFAYDGVWGAGDRRRLVVQQQTV